MFPLAPQQRKEKGDHCIKTIIVAGRRIEVVCLLSTDNTELLHFFIKFNGNDLKAHHITYHKPGDAKNPDGRRTHIKDEATNKYKLIQFGSENFSSTAWITSPDRSVTLADNADVVVPNTLPFITFRFCVTPANLNVETNEVIYPAPGSVNHRHEWKNKVINIIKTENDVLDIEVVEACCRVVKRPPFDTHGRDFSSVSQEIWRVDKDGRLTSERFIPTWIF